MFGNADPDDSDAFFLTVAYAPREWRKVESYIGLAIRGNDGRLRYP